MALAIEDYGFIGDLHTGALVGRDGSIDWLCLPRFDSGACFAALLGTPEHGRWLLAPAGEYGSDYTSTRSYRPDTLVLETVFTTASGSVRVIDCMPVRDEIPDLIRRVEGISGTVEMFTELRLRFDYGSIVPWVRVDTANTSSTHFRAQVIAGPDTVVVDASVPMVDDDHVGRARFRMSAGGSADFRIGWTGPRAKMVPLPDVERSINETEKWWQRWSSRCRYQGPDRDAVVRSLVTLKGLTYAPSGGIVAALTTSLPERLGGVRNWDYRYCWIRDATYTLLVLIEGGYIDEARRWREWLVRAIAGQPEQMQIMYGLDGERRLTEEILPWLPGYQGAAPVRTGNGASTQLQLDVFGELMDSLYHARVAGLGQAPEGWLVQTQLMDFLESKWQEPDEGIWEVRGPRRHFTHSKVMAWVAMDRAVRTVEEFGIDGPLTEWRRTSEEIRAQVLSLGFDSSRNTFTQSYGSRALDASTLLIAPVGFLPANDPRVLGTVAAIERELMQGGFVRRYNNEDESEVDGLPPGEGAFLACTFWLADNYSLQGRHADACRIMDRLLALRNDLGLLAEEYDVVSQRQVGNFPQALSHIQLVSTAVTLSAASGEASMSGPAKTRSGGS
jgi:GH15 family glucan-1,4-alpha-glucosidase